MDKRELRRDLFVRLRLLAEDDKAARSASIRVSLEGEPRFREAGLVFSYVALPSEPDLGPLFTAHPEKRWAFPCIGSDGRLTFHEVSAIGDLAPGSHRILEPDPLRHDPLSPGDADLVLVPGVGFDPATRARIGRGKGYYDRYLAAALDLPKHPFIIGLAFAVQLTELAIEAHDIPMDRLLTDEGWI